MNRRSMFLLGAGSVSVLALAACSKTGNLVTNTKVTVNLANAQAEANAIQTALSSFVTELVSTLNTTLQTQVNTYLKLVQAAVAQFIALPNGSTTYIGLAQNVVNAIQKLVPLIPIPAPTQVAITEGLTLLTALIAGIATINITPVSSSALVMGRSPRMAVAPIAIPY